MFLRIQEVGSMNHVMDKQTVRSLISGVVKSSVY